MFKAEVILASKNTFGQRITTMLITFPRYILAELNTHRMLSKNSASSRAIPFEKMLKSVQENPFIPIAWMKDHKGMQGTEYLSKKERNSSTDSFITWRSEHDAATASWLAGRDEAMNRAIVQNALGVTKQMCNRLLEPFAWHTVLVTATEWENFFALRADPQADIHMQEVAHKMLEAYNDAYVIQLEPDQWHIPFFTWEDVSRDKTRVKEMEEHLIKVSTARCAQTSYTVVGEEGKPMDHEKLIKLHDRLLASGHMSPFEHCAKAMTEDEYHQNIRQSSDIVVKDNNITTLRASEFGWCKNFRGFIQYRALLPNETRSDNRVKH